MKRIKILGLAVFAMFALTALGAVSAQATGTAPEWFECAKSAKGLGHYLGKECKKSEFKATGGKYDLVPGVGKGKAFKSKGGAAVLHSVNPETNTDIPVECASFKGGGKAVAPNLVTGVTTTFSKCKALGAPCENGKKETIVTKTLAGSLGWISKPGKIVGTDLALETAPGEPVAEFKCEALGEVHTKGSVIGENTGDVEAISKVSTLVFKPGKFLGPVEWAPGKFYEPIVNIPEFEGGSPDILKTELKGSLTGHPTEFYPPGGLPSGQEGESEQKGEALGIFEEGSE